MKHSPRILPNRDEVGRFAAKPNYFKITFILGFILFIIGGTLYSVIFAPTETEAATVDVFKTECHFMDGGYSCDDPKEIVEALSDYSDICGLDSVVCEGEPKNKEAAILLKVCGEEGLDARCAADLYGMAQHESYMGREMIGDSGYSFGYFHIMDYHNVPKNCSYDLECSARWTLARMIRYEYKSDREYAIMRHNGTAYTKATLTYLAKVEAKSTNFNK